MSANNILIIEEGKDGQFRGYDLDVDAGKVGLPTPVFRALSLTSAIKKAELYCNDNIVEYNYRVSFFQDDDLIYLIQSYIKHSDNGSEPCSIAYDQICDCENGRIVCKLIRQWYIGRK